MKKNFKLVLALVLSIMMVLGSMSALAADPAHGAVGDTHTVTITPNNTFTAHSYEAYQIFTGALNAAQGDIADNAAPVQLNSIQWGSNVDGAKLIAALKADNTLSADFTDVKDAPDVATVLATYSNDDSKMRAFAAVLGNAADVLTGTPTTGTATAGQNVVIENLTDGYYFIKDTDNSQNVENGSYSRFILRVVGNTTVVAKDTVPSIDKVIVEGQTDVHTSNGSIGDKVSYKITGKVPNMDGYESYLYKLSDTMTTGLTFNDDIAVKIGDATLIEVKESNNKFYPLNDNGDADTTKDSVTAGYVVNRNPASGTFEISIVNFIQYTANADILVTYSATINEDAVLDEDHQDNTAKLTYSNNPNQSGKGENGEPKTTNPTGEGPDKTVTTYTTAIEILKKDAINTNKLLSGAVFTLTGDAVNVTIVKQGMFVEDTAVTTGHYYLLKDGTYTLTVPGSDSGQTDAQGQPILVSTDDYMYTDRTYTNVTTVDETYNNNSKHFAADVTGNDGEVSFKGLGKGLYTLTETKAPVGYNLLTSPIYIYIDFERADADATVGALKAYKYEGSGAPTGTFDKTNSNWTAMSKNTAGSYKDFYHTDVVNNSGTTLPSTGGFGTTIFYVAGSILVLAAAILLITKRRMGSND